jgi:hypothetical protein
MKTQILNSKGEPIVLSDMEKRSANYNQQIMNALGYEIDITTLTAISKRVVEQKFFQIPPADYLPLRVGDGAWSSEILTYRDFAVGDDFSTGVLNTAAANSRFAETDAAVDSISVPVINWGKQISWTIFDLQMASRSGNWDLVTSKERSRKKNWDLGIQKVAFLGLDGNANVRGLLTQGDVTANTTLITKYINAMTEAEFQTLLQGIIEAYRSNANRTQMPSHFIIPEADYNGLAVATSENFPLVSKLERLIQVFRTITMNPGFKVLPAAYADKANNADNVYLDKNRYTLLNYDEDSLRMDIPVDYTNTLQNTINGAQFQNVGYGQFTGVKAYRPLEMLYFDWD